MKTRALTALPLVLAFAVAAQAQGVYVYDAISPGIADLGYLDSAAYPGGAPSPLGPMPMPSAAALPPAAFPMGGMAADDVTGAVYTSDGFLVATDYNPAHLPFLGGPPPIVPPLPIPFPPGFGPVTGMAVDSAAGILWMCDAGAVAPYTLGAPFAPLGPPVPLPFLAGLPLSGLGFESSTGTLWAVDVGGAVFHFTPAGAPVGPQPVALVAPGPFVPGMCGLSVNTSNGAGAFAPPPCSPQTGGQHVTVTDGFFIYDAVPGLAPPVPIAMPSGAGAMGMAYSSVFQHIPGAGLCPTFPGPPKVGTLAPNAVGPLVAPVAQGLAMVGGPPIATVTLLADLCPIPGGAFIPVTGETLWVSPFSPTFVSGGAITDAAGTAVIPLSFVPLPAGVQFTFQWAIPSSASPLGVCLTDAATVTTGLP